MSNINDVLTHMKENTYKFSIPLLSNKKEKVIIRPIKTKDQKILAVESEESDSDLYQFTLLLRLLDACMVKNKIPLGDMLLEDFFWLIINLRKKSLGEKIELFGNCEKCDQKKNPLTIDLDKDVSEKYLGKLKKNVIDISDLLKISIKFVCLDDMIDILAMKSDGVDGTELSLASMIDVVELDEEIIDIESIEDKLQLLGEMSDLQLQKFKDFIEENTFGVKIKTKYTCRNPECNHVNALEMDGFDIIDFF